MQLAENVLSESWYFAMQNLANYTVKSIMSAYEFCFVLCINFTFYQLS